jgi:polar amino acid transport system ATP-binding protein
LPSPDENPTTPDVDAGPGHDVADAPLAFGADGAPPAIQFENVVKKYGDHTVLEDLNFSVRQGEKVTLIGPSGSGKTTILRLAMTLEHLTGGYIYVDGEPLTHERRGGKRVERKKKDIAKMTRRIGMVFQQFNLFPNMTVIENITEAPIHVLGRSKAEARARGIELLEQVGLEDKADEHPSRLSGGQQQRVAIARALAMDPEIVGEVLWVLREVAKNTDITMLIVTHEMTFAQDVSDRVLMFDGGQIIEDKTPEVMFSSPEHERTRAFLQAVL